MGEISSLVALTANKVVAENIRRGTAVNKTTSCIFINVCPLSKTKQITRFMSNNNRQLIEMRTSSLFLVNPLTVGAEFALKVAPRTSKDPINKLMAPPVSCKHTKENKAGEEQGRSKTAMCQHTKPT
jgi:hypothetical protein